MTERNGFRLAVRTLTAVVLLVSGVYVMVYLYRWEWNRALISGIFFLAAEVGVVTALLFARLNRLEQALQQMPPVRPDVEAQARPDSDGESHFAWLDPADGEGEARRQRGDRRVPAPEVHRLPPGRHPRRGAGDGGAGQHRTARTPAGGVSPA